MTRLTLIALLILSAGPGWADETPHKFDWPVTVSQFIDTSKMASTASISVSTDKGMITLDAATGKVTIPAGLSLDQASRAFYEAVAPVLTSAAKPSCAAIDTLTKPEGK